MTLNELKNEYGAFQDLRGEFMAAIQELDDVAVSQAVLHRDFGITPTTVRRLRSTGKIRPVRKSRRRRARLRYRVRDVLLAVVRNGTGRVRNHE